MTALSNRDEAADWPAPVEVVNAASPSPLVLICEHASNHIPDAYARLGLDAADLERHIAYDVGAAEVTRRMAETLGAAAFLGTYSRLLVDLNRPFGVPQSMPALSEATRIPGNEGLPEDERAFRRAHMFDPFHEALAAFLDRRAGRATVIVAIHSFTPVFLGVPRPWHVGILHEGRDAFGPSLIAALKNETGLVVGENVPYTIERDGDYAIPVHGTDRGLPAVLVEIRNDLIRTTEGAAVWAARLGSALQPHIANPQPAAARSD